ncbi:hypothetical protein [Candidatus Berkiella aquae]|uniref:DUF2059 domain-containing protein n=2 Tax=Candidatus Berkiella aquae TaxID=295108 RepID=A0AAE3HUF0_9GAMM|nr:hypothetical protein [Candidatus Berkiella aquae]MCS5710872.1 hypothetical protein [Candidatus Berkiella aquae]
MVKTKVILLIIVGLLSFSLKAAGPAMHVTLGEKWIATFAPEYTEEQKKLFLLGTVFPDIRYLGVIKRTQTHFKGMTLEKVYATDSPFMRGMYFHSFVDEYRDRCVRKTGIEKTITEIPRSQQGTFLKLIEDQVLHSQYRWPEFKKYLMSIPEDEKKFGLELSALTQWHTALTLYFSTKPSMILQQVGMFEQNILTLDAQTIKSWGTLLPQYADSSEMKKHVEQMLHAFDEAFTSLHVVQQ